MAAFVRGFRHWCYAYFSKPVADRRVYQLLRKQAVQKILEIGIGNAERSLRMIEMAATRFPVEQVSFSGVDLFEMRSADQPAGLSLKAAHKKLTASGARIRLVPGDPFAALARMANTIGPTDLIVISADQTGESLARAWFYLPRLMHETSQVLQETLVNGQLQLLPISMLEIHRLAGTGQKRRAA